MRTCSIALLVLPLCACNLVLPLTEQAGGAAPDSSPRLDARTDSPLTQEQGGLDRGPAAEGLLADLPTDSDAPVAEAGPDADGGTTLDDGTTLDGGATICTAKQVATRTASQLPTPPMGRLYAPRMVYHQLRGSLLVYGGAKPTTGGGQQPQAELWELKGGSWNRLCAACAPGPRHSHGMVYDAKRQRVVLFGGTDDSKPLGDLWEWDGTSWSQPMPPGSAPAPRESMNMAYDAARGVTVIFGGDAGGSTTLGDLWEWDGTSWTQPGQGSPKPAARGQWGGQGAAYDPQHHGVVVYGGGVQGLQTLLDDAWLWDGATWTQLCDPCLGTARTANTVVYDPGLRAVLVFGGYDGGELAGTWALSTGGAAQLEPSWPPARDSMAAAFDCAGQRVVIYGGNGYTCSGATPTHCEDLLVYK